MKITLRHTALFASIALLGACASTPPGPPAEVVRLQNELDHLHSDPHVGPFADDELRRADNEVAVLAREGRHMDQRIYVHRLYVADRLVQTAEADGLARYAEQHAKDLGAERDRLVIESRTREVRDARATANAALTAAEIERRNADLARADASMARADASNARMELDTMRGKLTELQTQQTERGLVVTLGDVLFEVDRAELKPGATRKLDELVDALRTDANTTIAIEGHTDSTGGRDHNVELSQRRAESVQSYLVTHGISPSRVSARGMGPDYPVASNTSDAGRQQNRRVEVVVQTLVAR